MTALNEYWHSFLESLPRIGFALLLLAVLLFAFSQFSRLVRTRLTGKAYDPLFGRFLANLIRYALILVACILFLHVAGLSGIAGGLLAGAGISAFIFGFAFKDIAENFLAGIILAFDRPFALNDTVTIAGQTGHVAALNFRTTHIKTFDEKDVFIPNATIIKDTLTNLTRDGHIRIDFLVGIAYEDDIRAAVDTMLRSVEGLQDVRKDKQPFAVVEELAVSTVNIRFFFWTDTDDYKRGVLETKGRVIRQVKEALVSGGFTLPADIHELKLYDKREAFPVTLKAENNL